MSQLSLSSFSASEISPESSFASAGCCNIGYIATLRWTRKRVYNTQSEFFFEVAFLTKSDAALGVCKHKIVVGIAWSLIAALHAALARLSNINPPPALCQPACRIHFRCMSSNLRLTHAHAWHRASIDYPLFLVRPFGRLIAGFERFDRRKNEKFRGQV